FRRLGACAAAQALDTEDQIWDAWMHHPHRAAAAVLDAATRDIAARRYDIAETRLSALLRAAPRYAEAWHKRATLYYLLGRDEECLHDIRRTLELEPRHFAAMLHFAEVLLVPRGEGADARPAPEAAQLQDIRFACFAALSVHPHLPRAKELIEQSDE